MKKIIILFLSGISLISCSSDNMPSQNSALIGKWKWVSSIGGVSGTTTTTQSSGQNIKIEITDTKVKKYTNDILLSVCNYSIQSGKSIYGANQNLIIYDNNSKESFYLSNDNKQLVFKEECYDSYQKTYIKEGIRSNQLQ